MPLLPCQAQRRLGQMDARGTSSGCHRGWAEMIRKVYEVDPLVCLSCEGQMKIITFIEAHKVIDRIIGHLNLRFGAERPSPPQVAKHELLLAAEEMGEYF